MSTGNFSECLNGGSVVIVDHFLAREERLSIWEQFTSREFVKVHEAGFARAFRLYDGEALVSRDHCLLRREPGTVEDEEAVVRLPHGEALNGLSAALLSSDVVAEFLEAAPDWETLSLQLYVYPPGSGLGWHRDKAKSAAFIYYAHPAWHSSWGGELLVAPPTPEGTAPAADLQGPSAADFREFYRGLDDNAGGLHPAGSFIAPVPNRLVLIKGGVPHAIKKVEPAAGEAFRASISGFFS